MDRLSAPFPYYGGKSRHAGEVWRRFGSPDVYVEPFAGSLAVLLSREVPCRREVVCDLDAHISNFWRAMQKDPGVVAFHADWPTIHQDLTARHRWLILWARENRVRVSEDPDYFDAKAAGWWAWGRSNWIGHGWCRDNGFDQDKRPRSGWKTGGIGVMKKDVEDKRPQVTGSRTASVGVQVGRVRDGRPATHGHPTGAGVQVGRESWPASRPQCGSGGRGITSQGVQAQREVPEHRNRVPAVGESGAAHGVQTGRSQIPAVSRDPGGGGVQVQRKNNKQMPHVGSELGGMGVAVNRVQLPPHVGSGERLIPWFRALQQRLARVIVLARSWESAVTPSILSDTASSPNLTRAIFLDPPYPTDQRKSGLYGEDDEGQVARASYEWAVENGERYRIAYCCLPGQFPVPDGWSEWKLGTQGSKATDHVMFSPACIPRRSLFPGT